MKSQGNQTNQLKMSSLQEKINRLPTENGTEFCAHDEDVQDYFKDYDRTNPVMYIHARRFESGSVGLVIATRFSKFIRLEWVSSKATPTWERVKEWFQSVCEIEKRNAPFAKRALECHDGEGAAIIFEPKEPEVAESPQTSESQCTSEKEAKNEQ